MWYITIPPFIPMDPNMYSIYYFRIKGFHPLIFGRKDNYASDTTQAKLVPPVE
jgi:hypothetical protein